MKKSFLLPKVSVPAKQSASRRLLFMRWLWLLLAPVLLVLTCFFFPLQVALVHTVCTRNPCSFFQPTPDTLSSLNRLHFSLDALTVLVVSLIGICALTWLAIAVLLAWKTFHNWFALSVSLLALVQTAMAARPPDLLVSQQSPWLSTAVTLLLALDATVYVLLGTLFPNGKLIPRWTRLIFLVWFVIGLPCILLSGFPSPLSPDWQNVMGIVSTYCWMLCIAAIIVAQVYRYRCISSSLERQQTKWVLFFGGISLLEQAIVYSFNLFFPTLSTPGAFYSLLYYPLTKLFLTFFGLSLLIALLRYRLWDIDHIINRTLVYGLLTTILALVYIGLVSILQLLLSSIVSQTETSSLVLVASTLITFVLFRPLRNVLQSRIDRYFYRQKYDASRVIAHFSHTLHHTLDLADIQQQLLQTVQQTMQPVSLSLWLLPVARRKEDLPD